MRLGQPDRGPEQQPYDPETGEHAPKAGPWPLAQERGGEEMVLGQATRVHERLLGCSRSPHSPGGCSEFPPFGSSAVRLWPDPWHCVPASRRVCLCREEGLDLL